MATGSNTWTVHSLSPGLHSLLARFRGELGNLFGSRLEELRLYGSYARGEAHEESDVDVLVVLDWVEPGDWDAIFGVVGALWLDTDLRISPTILDAATAAKWRAQQRPLMKDIDRQGLPV